MVTGANSGIGWHTAAELARHGADVTLAVRNVDKGEAAAAKMREGATGAVRVARLDLASLASVQEFAEAWDGPLGLLVNNAGLMAPPRYQATEDGFELQFGTNHLGHFALTGRLLPALLAAPAPRVVTVSSIAHHQGRADVVEGNPAERYNPAATYGNSKLANLLFAARAAAAGVAGRGRADLDGRAPRGRLDPAGHQRAGPRRHPGRQAARAAVPQDRVPVPEGGRAAHAVRRDGRHPGLVHRPADAAGVARPARTREAGPARLRRVAGRQAVDGQRGPHRRAVRLGDVRDLSRFTRRPRLGP